MKCINCKKEIKKGEFVVMNGGAMTKTRTGAKMDKKLLSFLSFTNHFDSTKNYQTVDMIMENYSGQFEIYACSAKCLAKHITDNIMLLDKLKGQKKIVLAKTKNIDRLADKVDKVLSILGFEGALVTDESTVWDFCPVIGSTKKDREKYLAKINKKLGFKITEGDFIWKIAEKL